MNASKQGRILTTREIINVNFWRLETATFKPLQVSFYHSFRLQFSPLNENNVLVQKQFHQGTPMIVKFVGWVAMAGGGTQYLNAK